MVLSNTGVARFQATGLVANILELVSLMLGVGFLAFLIAVVTSRMEISDSEFFAMDYLKIYRMNEKKQSHAAELIQVIALCAHCTL